MSPPPSRPRSRPTPGPRLPAGIAPHLGPIEDDRGSDRDRFEAHELGLVLSHYDLGVITRIREHPRGSRRAPKLRISAESGEFLLKRRAPGREEPDRVAFSQSLQHHLADRGYPVPRIARTRRGASLVQHGGRSYELFEYVNGRRDDGSTAAAAQAGLALGTLHRVLDELPTVGGPMATYHRAAGFDAAIARVPAMIASAEPAVVTDEIEGVCHTLAAAYHDAARRAEAVGLERWRPCVIHGDWHPGNLLYRDGRVAAVLDFDSARIAPRIIDVANGALQFSMMMTDRNDPARWPDGLDAKRIRGLVRGYDEASASPVSDGEREALPWLVLEALIQETVVPLAATGRFARLSGWAFLRMVDRKVRWLQPRASRLAAYLAEDPTARRTPDHDRDRAANGDTFGP